MKHNSEQTGVDTSTKQDVSTPPVHDESGNKFAPGNKANATGKGGFGDHPENRSSGSWKKETTPRGKLEALLQDATVGEFLTQIKEANIDTNLDAKLGDVLISGRLNNVIKEDPDSNGKIKVDSNEMDKLLYFVYGSKSEFDGRLGDMEGNPLIKGFVIPVAPPGFTPELDGIIPGQPIVDEPIDTPPPKSVS